MYELIITSYYNQDVVEYPSLEAILEEYFPRSRNREMHEFFAKLQSEDEKIEFLEESLNWLDIPFSPEDDSPCRFKIQKLS